MSSSKPSRRTTLASNERTFLANAAHELRTPLHSAAGFVDLVLDGLAGPLNERQLEMLGYAHTAIGQLAVLIEDVLFLTRADSGELLPHLTTVDTATLLTRAIENVREALREKSVTLARADDGALPSMQGDADRIREGLTGLLRTGLSLTPSGGAMNVTASAEGGMLRYAIALGDVRLSPSDQDHLFDRFSQPRPLGAERAIQLGLGPTIAQITARWHGGSASAETAPDGSLILCYQVPLAQP